MSEDQEAPQAPEPAAVLLVEDDEQARALYAEALRGEGYEVVAAGSAAEASEELARRPFPAAVLDVFLPDGRGLSLLSLVHERDPQAVAIVITGYASLDTALEALRLGAYEYLCKPCSTDELLRALARGLERRELILGNLRLTERLAGLARQLRVPGKSLEGRMQAAADSLAAFADLSEGMAQTPGPSVALAAICQAAARLAGASLAAVLALREDSAQVAAAHGDVERVSAGRVLPLSPLLRAVAGQGKPIVASDLLFGDGFTDDLLAGAGLASAVVLPIVLQGRLKGALLCAHEQREAFAEEKTSLLALLAAQAAPALDQWMRAGPSGEDGQGFIEIDRLL